MRRHTPWAVLLLIVAVAFPAVADEKKPDGPLPKDEKEATEKLITGGELTGRLANWRKGEEKEFSVHVTVKYGVPNLEAMVHARNLQAQLARVAADRNKNPLQKRLEIQRIQVDILRNQQHLVSVREHSQTIHLQAADDLKVRLSQAPVVYDDKGSPRRPTRQELMAFKGPDRRLPGYTGTLDDLRQDQLVTVYLAKTRRAPRNARPSDEGPPPEKPKAVMILIVAEPPPEPPQS